jgi:hypothetical protein
MIVFCTSLDHFKNIEQVSNVVKHLSRKNAYILFFIGLHDVSLVAPSIGASIYSRIFSRLDFGHFAHQWLKNTILIPYHYYLMKKRNLMLNRNYALDEHHFHYFTDKNIREIIRHFGEVVNIMYIPHTNAMFIAVRRNEF